MRLIKILMISVLSTLIFSGCQNIEKDSRTKTFVEKENQEEEKEIIKIDDYFESILGIKKIPDTKQYIIYGVTSDGDLNSAKWSIEEGVLPVEDYNALYPIKDGYVATNSEDIDFSKLWSDGDADGIMVKEYPEAVLLDSEGNVIWKPEEDFGVYKAYVVNAERILIIEAKTGFDGIVSRSGVLDAEGNWICPMEKMNLSNKVYGNPIVGFKFDSEGEFWNLDVKIKDDIVLAGHEYIYSAQTDKILSVPVAELAGYQGYIWGGTKTSLWDGCSTADDVWEYLDLVLEGNRIKRDCGMYKSEDYNIDKLTHLSSENVLCTSKRETISLPENFSGREVTYLGMTNNTHIFELLGDDEATYLSVVGSDGKSILEPFKVGEKGAKLECLEITDRYILLKDEIAGYIVDFQNGSVIENVLLSNVKKASLIDENVLVQYCENEDDFFYIQICTVDGKTL